jgi:hypothetical protein
MSVAQLVGFHVVEHVNSTWMLVFFCIIPRFNDIVLSVAGDVPIDSNISVDFINVTIYRLCLSLSDVFIGVGYIYVCS